VVASPVISAQHAHRISAVLDDRREVQQPRIGVDDGYLWRSIFPFCFQALDFLNATAADDRDAKVLQVLDRQVRQDLLGYLVLAECCCILPLQRKPACQRRAG
jgi:hypothetical protein